MTNERRIFLAARVRPELVQELDRLAEATDRTRSYLVERAIADYVAAHHAQAQVPAPAKRRRAG